VLRLTRCCCHCWVLLLLLHPGTSRPAEGFHWQLLISMPHLSSSSSSAGGRIKTVSHIKASYCRVAGHNHLQKQYNLAADHCSCDTQPLEASRSLSQAPLHAYPGVCSLSLCQLQLLTQLNQHQ
jgi:hypothetical protein